MRASIKKLKDWLYLIDDDGHSTAYLVCGTERAMLIDTLNGYEDLRKIVEEITKLPLIVVNTHGHVDHIGGNFFFDEAWMHPADAKLAREHFGFYKREGVLEGKEPCPFKDLEIFQKFDLGGIQLEVIPLFGHTRGSVGILDRKNRILFSGDGINLHLWMQLDESLPMKALRETLGIVKNHYAKDFDYILTGHAKDFADASILDTLISGVDSLIARKTERDTPYDRWENSMQHPLSDNPDEVIVYRKGRI